MKWLIPKKNSRSRPLIIFAVLGFLLYQSALTVVKGRAELPSEPCPIRLDEASVIEMAKRTAVATGVKLERYTLDEVSFEFHYRTWTVSFDEKGPPYSFDGCFRVIVNDQTREAEFHACP